GGGHGLADLGHLLVVGPGQAEGQLRVGEVDHRTAGEQALGEEGPVEGEHRGGGDDRLVQVEERGDPAGPVRRPGTLVAWGGHDPSLRPLRTSARWVTMVMPE